MSSISRLADQLSEMDRRLGGLERSRSLSRSSLIDSSIEQIEMRDTGEVDELGAPIFEAVSSGSIGRQSDGGWTQTSTEGPTPPTPVAPTVVDGVGILTVAWSGQFVGDAPATSDFLGVEVLVASGSEFTRTGIITSAGEEFVVGSLTAGTYQVALRSISSALKLSETSDAVPGVISMSTTDDALKEAIAGSDQALSEAREGLTATFNDLTSALASEVSEMYATKDALEANRDATEVAIAAVADGASELVGTVSASVADLAQALSDSQDQLALYVRITSEGLELGSRTNSRFRVRITNTEMSFLQDNKVVAYISNNKLYITNAEITNNLALGSPSTGFFDFVPRSNGNLSFKFRGAS